MRLQNMNFCTACQGTGIVGGIAACAHCAGQSFIPHPDPTIMNIGNQWVHPVPQEPGFFPKPDPTFPNFPHDDKAHLCMSPLGIPWDLAIPHHIHPDVVPHYHDKGPEMV